MSKKTALVPKLIVMFDTNALYTGSASELVRQEVRSLIAENSSHPDLSIEWYLPSIVVSERRYQMRSKAKELLPNLEKLEKLLGHKLAIGEDTLELHIDKCIQNSLKESGFSVREVKVDDIDWLSLIEKSVNREPPFDPGEKEKGFRDSIIANTFLQLLAASPTTPSLCKLAIVSGDKRLRDYLAEHTVDARNVRLLSSNDELESLINTLVATIPEEMASALTKKAESLFFIKGNEKTLYYKEKIGERIREDFGEQLADTILEDHYRSGGTWWISNPIFIKKEKQKIYWVSAVEVEFEIYHYEDDPNASSTAFGDSDRSQGIASAIGLSSSSSTRTGFLDRLMQPKIKTVVFEGREKFEVHWSTNLSQSHNLTSPKIIDIKHQGNNLFEDP